MYCLISVKKLFIMLWNYPLLGVMLCFLRKPWIFLSFSQMPLWATPVTFASWRTRNKWWAICRAIYRRCASTFSPSQKHENTKTFNWKLSLAHRRGRRVWFRRKSAAQRSSLRHFRFFRTMPIWACAKIARALSKNNINAAQRDREGVFLCGFLGVLERKISVQ